MLPGKFAFIDIETTGTRSFYDRIIEIGILRMEENRLVKTFKTLLNPNTYIPKEITMITGLTAQDLENAPTFREVKEEVEELLSNCVFVAHNARFDYSFIKNEFARHNHTFSAKQLCTVKLSRLLYPHWERHNLDSVIQHCGLTCENRHRAFDDAKVLFKFYQYVQSVFDKEMVETAINTCMKKPSLPIKLEQKLLDELPEKPGVYIFYGANRSNSPSQEVPLYIGKSKNIRERVLSHFAADIRSGIEMKIAQQVEDIETIPTAGELGALLLESQLIKKMLPLYNRRSRLKREMVAVKSRITKLGYQEAYLEPIATIHLDENNSFLGFFKSRKQAKATLAELAKRHHLCEKLLGLEKTNGACFAHRLEQCKGACVNLEKPVMYNLRFLTAFANLKIATWPFQGMIMVEEGNNPNGKKEYFLIDQWCYVGNVVIDENGNQKDTSLNEINFDLDIYQILRQFLKHPENLKKIKTVPKNDFLTPQNKFLPI